MSDQRDDLTWVVLELSPVGEAKLIDQTLEKSVRKDLNVGEDFPIFIPAVTYPKKNKTVTVCLMEGYIFVAAGLDETAYFNLEHKPYISSVMTTKSGPYQLRTLSTVPNKQILDLKKQLRKMSSADVEVDDFVQVTEGTYKMLEGRVLGIHENEAFIRISLRSLELIATVPLMSLEVIESNKEL